MPQVSPGQPRKTGPLSCIEIVAVVRTGPLFKVGPSGTLVLVSVIPPLVRLVEAASAEFDRSIPFFCTGLPY